MRNGFLKVLYLPVLFAAATARQPHPGPEHKGLKAAIPGQPGVVHA